MEEWSELPPGKEPLDTMYAEYRDFGNGLRLDDLRRSFKYKIIDGA